MLYFNQCSSNKWFKYNNFVIKLRGSEQAIRLYQFSVRKWSETAVIVETHRFLIIARKKRRAILKARAFNRTNGN